MGKTDHPRDGACQAPWTSASAAERGQGLPYLLCPMWSFFHGARAAGARPAPLFALIFEAT
eukprot:6442642-Pyramimonas_sp.AAC.1